MPIYGMYKKIKGMLFRSSGKHCIRLLAVNLLL